MTELYWITRFGSLHNIGVAMFWTFLILAIILWLISIGTDDWTGEDCCTENQKRILRKNSSYSFIASIIGILMWTFIPTENEAFFIYGVGGTIDYIKQNPTAQKLPDKCINALDKWVDSWNEEKDSIRHK